MACLCENYLTAGTGCYQSAAVADGVATSEAFPEFCVESERPESRPVVRRISTMERIDLDDPAGPCRSWAWNAARRIRPPELPEPPRYSCEPKDVADWRLAEERHEVLISRGFKLHPVKGF